LEQLPLQHGVPPVLQVPPFGMHIGVVVVVGVSVVVVVGVSVVVVVGVSVVVVVGVSVVVVVGVSVVVVVGVSVVEVVGVSVVEVVGLSHGPRRSPWRKWRSTALWETALVCSSGVPGLWQMVTFCC
jgi:hypothetical protein